MGYLADVCYYFSNTECPEPFVIWSALSLHGAVLGRKVWTVHGDMFTMYPNLYVLLVGSAGSGKSTAKNFSKDVIVEHFPQLMISENVQSYQDIAQQMSLDECIFTWKDFKGAHGPSGKIYDYRPFYAIVDELSLFLAVDIKGMTNFLVNIYSDKHFGTGFKKDRGSGIPTRFRNPYFNLLACTIPEWLMMNLRYDLFTGGLGRRLQIVADEKKKFVANPIRPPDAETRLARAIEHLKRHGSDLFYGRLVKTPGAEKWWKAWYELGLRRINRDDPILRQYHETKHEPLLKLAILIALDEYDCTMEIKEEHLQFALHIIDSLEPAVVRLTSGIGRNEIAGIVTAMLEVISGPTCEGAIVEKDLHWQFFRHLRDAEYAEALNLLCNTDKVVSWVVKKDGVERRMIMTPDRYQLELKRQKDRKA